MAVGSRTDCVNSMRSMAEALDKLTADNNAQNIIAVVFGVLPVVLTLIGLGLAYMQLRGSRIVFDLEALQELGQQSQQQTTEAYEANQSS